MALPTQKPATANIWPLVVGPTQSILLNANFINLNAKFIDVNAEFLTFDAKFIISNTDRPRSRLPASPATKHPQLLPASHVLPPAIILRNYSRSYSPQFSAILIGLLTLLPNSSPPCAPINPFCAKGTPTQAYTIHHFECKMHHL